jgi:hypothetical protein
MNGRMHDCNLQLIAKLDMVTSQRDLLTKEVVSLKDERDALADENLVLTADASLHTQIVTSIVSITQERDTLSVDNTMLKKQNVALHDQMSVLALAKAVNMEHMSDINAFIKSEHLLKCVSRALQTLPNFEQSKHKIENRIGENDNSWCKHEKKFEKVYGVSCTSRKRSSSLKKVIEERRQRRGDTTSEMEDDDVDIGGVAMPYTPSYTPANGSPDSPSYTPSYTPSNGSPDSPPYTPAYSARSPPYSPITPYTPDTAVTYNPVTPNSPDQIGIYNSYRSSMH